MRRAAGPILRTERRGTRPQDRDNSAISSSDCHSPLSRLCHRSTITALEGRITPPSGWRRGSSSSRTTASLSTATGCRRPTSPPSSNPCPPDRNKLLRTHRGCRVGRFPVSEPFDAACARFQLRRASSASVTISPRVLVGSDGHASMSRARSASATESAEIAPDFAARDWVDFRNVLSPRELAECSSTPSGPTFHLARIHIQPHHLTQTRKPLPLPVLGAIPCESVWPSVASILRL